MNQRHIAKFLLVSASFLTLEMSVARADELARDTAAPGVVARIAEQPYQGPLDTRTIDPRKFQRR
ncbi:hypothetical protein PTE30175_04282 [Pandoraea terrae]|uniref:Uncharacterized protein n=1 Tax=Pandoraea terrae TaxID=1537710 RepID=A0A5E4YB47_9BURK|nr:hypothetical protein [Pandoraea terrae]VVE45423.1 hypothetical protein PTE30175_04282 [Pandoraea terrae]